MKKTTINIIFIALFISGCSARLDYTDAPTTMSGLYSKYAVEAYNESTLPISEVGIITLASGLDIISVNGLLLDSYRAYTDKGFYSGGRYQLHLLDGTHKINLALDYYGSQGERVWSKENIEKDITIKKGQVIHLSWKYDNRKWRIIESDGIAAIKIISDDYFELKKSK